MVSDSPSWRPKMEMSRAGSRGGGLLSPDSGWVLPTGGDPPSTKPVLVGKLRASPQSESPLWPLREKTGPRWQGNARRPHGERSKHRPLATGDCWGESLDPALGKMADREGFEPSVLLLAHTLSKRAHSTTLTPALQWKGADPRGRLPAWQPDFLRESTPRPPEVDECVTPGQFVAP